jgi:hypothetical protein
MGKGYISETMFAGRILSHGKITSLDAAFSLTNNEPFSLFLVAASGTDETLPVLVNCKLYADDEAANCPFVANQWNEPAVIEVAASGVSLTDYTVYWGAGSDIQ